MNKYRGKTHILKIQHSNTIHITVLHTYFRIMDYNIVVEYLFFNVE